MRSKPIAEKILLAFIVAPFVVLFGSFGARFITVRADNANRGDIISFRYPLNPSVWFAKRVVAVGGDTVEIREKCLFVNGVEAVEHSP